MIPKVFPNPAHQRAYENGVMAARNGKERFPPYSIDSNSSRYFRRAWLAGYDGAAERMSSNDELSRPATAGHETRRDREAGSA